MNTTEQILLAGLAAALLVFLIMAIVIAVMVMRLLKAINRLSDKAEHVMETAETVGEVFRNAAGPMALLKVVTNIVRTVKRNK